MLHLTVDYLNAVNLALLRSGVSLCKNLELKSEGESLSNVIVRCTGHYVDATASAVIAELPANQSVRLKDFEIRVPADKIALLTEKTQSSFRLTVCRLGTSDEAEVELFQRDFPLEIMPADQWLGTSIIPQSIVSFVTPNHPAISNLIVKAAAKLKETSGASAFMEYQSGNPEDVVHQVAAIYAALHEERIVYRSLPAGYEAVGQRVTLPSAVLAQKLGNCLDLTLLFATVLEAVGINSAIILQKGHAFLGVWLVDDCCNYSVCDDASYLEKKISKGIGEMLVLESTQITSETTSFLEAQRMAERELSVLERFRMFIDVRRCRIENFLPLPLLTNADGTWTLATDAGVEHDLCSVEYKKPSRYDLNRVVEGDNKLTRLDIWERKLLDFSLRNNMLNLSLRQRAIQCISFDVDKIEDRLQDGDEYCVLEKPAVEFSVPQDERLVRSKQVEQLRPLVSEDIKHHRLHTYHAEQETKSVLKNIYRVARNAIEETGANSLYMAIGTLRWYETDVSERARYAPILLLPIEMIYKKGNYYIRTREEEIVLNITLVEFLRQNYGITFRGLTPLPTDDSGVDVSLIFTIIRDALRDRRRWDVEEECIIGIFSFSKYLMWNDIHNHRQELLANDIVKSLADLRLAWQPAPIVSDLREEDRTIVPQELALPVPVDSSQLAAVCEAGKGHSFILYGPPGTGKSQTITNLIANALFHSKRVLFVAEKMAALSVVQNRLEKINLGPFCLEMHSNKASKRHVLDQLAKALAVKHLAPEEKYEETAARLFEEREQLIAYVNDLHRRDASDGLSLYDCIVRYEAISAERNPAFASVGACEQHITAGNLPDIENLLGSRLKAIVQVVGQPASHPLLGLGVSDEAIANSADTEQKMRQAVEAADVLRKEYDALARVSELKARLLKDNAPELLQADGNALRNQWRAAKAKWFLPRVFAKKSFLGRMRAFNPYITEDELDQTLEMLVEAQDLRQRLDALLQKIEPYYSLSSSSADIPTCEQTEQAAQALKRWQDHLPRMREWFHWSQYVRELRSKGFDALVDVLEREPFDVGSVCDAFMKEIFRQKILNKSQQSPLFRTFEGLLFDQRVSQYKQYAAAFEQLSQRELYAKLAANIPHATLSPNALSELGYLNRNISNGARGTSLRDLLDHLPNLLPRLCPCMLMSPMSVAQYLDLNLEKFDLVIFDEASQMPTSESIGAIARGKALVVVGDPKQMPPTSFFASTNVNEDEADIDDMESILEDCRTLQLPSLQLSWHYRSKHESLIAFSNNEYYDGSLITFPSVDDQQKKVRLIHIKGTYERSSRRTNRAEAQAVVDEVVKRLRDETCHQSIGIVAFSVVQQNLIDDLLLEALDNDNHLRELADALYEPIFVKNLENVQGDERDVILFSIGYGPDKDGKVSMNFGPLNNAGGERRLNVAVSRAREEMLVFSSLRFSDIDLRRSKALGVKGLRDFLEYAEVQNIATIAQTVERTDDVVLAKQIAQALEQKGYTASTNVGRSKFKVAVAVGRREQPDVYSLAVLLDGRGYEETQTTRDREIVQPTVLERLGWEVLRVRSIDWFNKPADVIERIVERLNSGKPETPKPIVPKLDISKETTLEQPSNAIKYKAFVPTTATYLNEVQLALAIVENEQPVTLTYLCRRICQSRGDARVTKTLTDEMRRLAYSQCFVQSDGDELTIWTAADKAANYKGYRPNENGERIVEHIPSIEIRNALLEVVREQVAVQHAGLTALAAKKMGFARRGSKVTAAFDKALADLLRAGTLVCHNGVVKLADPAS